MSRRTYVASAILLGILLVGLFDYAVVQYGLVHHGPAAHGLVHQQASVNDDKVSYRFFESLRADFIHHFGCHGLGKVFCELFDASVQTNTRVKDYHHALINEIQQALHQCLVQFKQQGKLADECQFLINYQYVDESDNGRQYSIEDVYRLSHRSNNDAELKVTLKVIEQLKFKTKSS